MRRRRRPRVHPPRHCESRAASPPPRPTGPRRAGGRSSPPRPAAPARATAGAASWTDLRLFGPSYVLSLRTSVTSTLWAPSSPTPVILGDCPLESLRRASALGRGIWHWVGAGAPRAGGRLRRGRR